MRLTVKLIDNSLKYFTVDSTPAEFIDQLYRNLESDGKDFLVINGINSGGVFRWADIKCMEYWQ